MPRLHFVQELPVGSSRRDKELEGAKARAHAASVSYQKDLSSQPEPRPPSSPGEYSRPRRIGTGTTGRKSSIRRSTAGPSSWHNPPSTDSTEYGLDTPPDSPVRRTSTSTQADESLFANSCSQGEFTALPNRHQSETRDGDKDLDSQHSEDISTDADASALGSSSFSSSASIRLTKYSHGAYQINSYASNAQTHWLVSSSKIANINLSSIPHDLHGTRADPFDCIPHRNTRSASVNAVTDYHAQIMAPNHAPIYKIFNVTNVYTSYYYELLFAHPDFLYTGVASVHAVIDQLRRRPDEPVGPSEQVLKHIGTAMGRLRKRIGRLQKEARDMAREKRCQDHYQNYTGRDINVDSHDDGTHNSTSFDPNPTLAVDDMTIMTVLFLAVVTRAINDLPSHEIHKKTIASLVAARGGLSNMTGHDGLARCMLMQWESFWALETGTTIFPDARPPYNPIYPPITIDPTGELAWKIASLPSGFQPMAEQKRLALDVIEVLSRTVQAHIDQALHRTIVTPSDVFRSKPRKFRDFWEACTCLGAHDETYFDSEGMPVKMPSLEKLIVLALLLYCLHTFSPMRAVTAVYNGSRLKLMTDLPKRLRRDIAPLCTTPSPPSTYPSPDTIYTSSSTTTVFENSNPDEKDSKFQETEEAVLLWTYFNLVDSWRAANDTLLPQGVSIMLDLRMRFPSETASWERCEEVLKMFFWNERFLGRCAKFWIIGEVERLRREASAGV